MLAGSTKACNGCLCNAKRDLSLEQGTVLPGRKSVQPSVTASSSISCIQSAAAASRRQQDPRNHLCATAKMLAKLRLTLPDRQKSLSEFKIHQKKYFETFNPIPNLSGLPGSRLNNIRLKVKGHGIKEVMPNTNLRNNAPDRNSTLSGIPRNSAAQCTGSGIRLDPELPNATFIQGLRPCRGL